ncbi:CHRD domain-containing protein [Pseudanabaenaceae cyanobacterium LEGE 13415]|nr:CHRD domain-containing protein [Pseudanabaenaceae cyanobacterium LEGE 13415]
MELNNFDQVKAVELDQVDGIGDVSTTAADTASASNRTGSSIRESDVQASLNSIARVGDSSGLQARSFGGRGFFDDLENRFNSPETKDFLRDLGNRFNLGDDFQDQIRRALDSFRDRFDDFDRPNNPPDGGDTPPVGENPPESEKPPVAENPPEEEQPPAENPEPPVAENPEEDNGEQPPAENPEEDNGEQPPVAENPPEEEQPPVAENPEEEQPPAENPEEDNGEQPPVAENPEEEQPQPEAPIGEKPEQPEAAKSKFRIDLSQVNSQRGLDAEQVEQLDLRVLADNATDVLAPQGGVNTVIGSGQGDAILSNTAGSFNTITTGDGADFIVLGDEATNRVFDFDPNEDKLVLTGDVSIDDIVIGQGKSTTTGGLQQPLDFFRHTLVVDRSTNNILATLQFTPSDTISNADFAQLQPEAVKQVAESNLPPEFDFFARDIARTAPSTTEPESEAPNPQQSSGAVNEHNHSGPKVPNVPTLGQDFNRVEARDVAGRSVSIGGNGNDFIRPDDAAFSFENAVGGGQTEFPFATDSPGTSEVAIEFANDVLSLDGTFQNFDGEPLFINGETTIAEEATNLSPTAEATLLTNFLAVSNDSEGNVRTGTHLHYSPAGDFRPNAADATVVRFLDNTVNEDGKSGTFSGEFNLSPEEQAALAAGNLYINIHTNQDGDGDGKGGFITGENRLNLNKEKVRIA